MQAASLPEKESGVEDVIVRSDVLLALLSRARGVETDTAEAYTVTDLVKDCQALSDPNWAMEELERVRPGRDAWIGSCLPSSVWALPGSADCPFHTKPTDSA